MPANHYIDNEEKIIFTDWQGEPSDGDLVDALNNYFRDIKSRAELDGFNELVDFSDIRGLKLSITVMIELGKISSKFDSSGNKLAIVTNSSFTYGLARMYGIFRKHNPQSNKEVLAFRSKEDAMEWLKSSDVVENDKAIFQKRNTSD